MTNFRKDLSKTYEIHKILCKLGSWCHWDGTSCHQYAAVRRGSKTDQLEWPLELALRGCVDKCAKNGDHIVTLNHQRQPLVQEGFLAVVITVVNTVCDDELNKTCSTSILMSSLH